RRAGRGGCWLRPLVGEGATKAAAHITGGGVVENTPRALPDHLEAAFDWSAWKRPAVFTWLQETGAVPEEDMRRTFNLGIGMALIVAKENADGVVATLEANGERAFVIGEVRGA